jgi:hypothetical protein
VPELAPYPGIEMIPGRNAYRDLFSINPARYAATFSRLAALVAWCAPGVRLTPRVKIGPLRFRSDPVMGDA